MVKNRLMSTFATLTLLFTTSQSWALTLNDVVKKVESNYKNIVAFRGSFNQTATIKTLNKIQQGQGDIFFKKPNKIKWQYRSPMEQEIISDGNTIWLYFPENRQVFIYDLTDTFDQEAANQGQIPGNFLASLGNLNKEFDVRWGQPKDRDERGNYIVELTPKRPMVNVRNIFLVVPKELLSGATPTTPLSPMEGQKCEYDGKPCTGTSLFPLLTSTVYDTFGNMTNIEFTSIEVLEVANETAAVKKRAWTLPDSMFTYLPPPQVEIIKPPLTRSK